MFKVINYTLTIIWTAIIYNNDFRGWGQKPFQFKRCANILIKNNKVQPPRTWSIEDCKLENTPADQVRIEN